MAWSSVRSGSMLAICPGVVSTASTSMHSGILLASLDNAAVFSSMVLCPE